MNYCNNACKVLIDHSQVEAFQSIGLNRKIEKKKMEKILIINFIISNLLQSLWKFEIFHLLEVLKDNKQNDFNLIMEIKNFFKLKLNIIIFQKVIC